MMRLFVRHVVEWADGHPVGVVHLIDRSVPLVERIWALPACEALTLACALNDAWGRADDPVRVSARDRDGAVIEFTLPMGCTLRACQTIARFAATANCRAGRARTRMPAAAVQPEVVA